MKRKKVLYQNAWQVEFLWIKKTKTDDQAFCNVYQSSFQIGNSGLSHVKAHANSNNVSKEKLLSGKTNQWVFVSASDKQMTFCSCSFVLSMTESRNQCKDSPSIRWCRFKLFFSEHEQWCKKISTYIQKVTGKLIPKLNTSFNLVLFLTLEKVCWRTLKINSLLLNLTN